VERASADRTALELLVHGVGGATPEKMLNDPRTVRITGDDTAAVYRRADDVAADTGPGDDRGRDAPVPEAYVWSNLTSGNGTRALWLLLLPFMVVNLAHWMRPAARERGAPEYAGPREDEAHTAWLPRTGHDAAQARRGW